MIFRRIYHDRLAQASYLIACEATRKAIVVDPLRDPGPYLEAAAFEDVRIELVAETHVHADFLSGAEALARATGAQLLLSAEGADHGAMERLGRTSARPLRHGDRIALGRVRLDVRHTPGHTPEHVVFFVTDEATSELAAGFLSGDFLFAGDVGRPDLLERAVGIEGSMETAAADLYRSLQAIRDLPEYLQVWPGHGAGSACGKSLGAVPQTTLGYELRSNWAFQIADEREFVRAALADQPEPPAYFARMKALNVRGPATMPPPSRLDASHLRARVREGVLVVDTRQSAEFLARHLHGSISIPNGRSFLTWAGSVLDPDRELVLLVPTEELHEFETLRHDLALIGYDHVLGALPAVDLETFGPRPVDAISVAPAMELSDHDSAVSVIDVRSELEWTEGHVPGAMHVPLAQLGRRLPELRDRAPLLFYCQTGARSATAASLLRAAGVRDVASADGGFEAWAREAGASAAGEPRS